MSAWLRGLIRADRWPEVVIDRRPYRGDDEPAHPALEYAVTERQIDVEEGRVPHGQHRKED